MDKKQKRRTAPIIEALEPRVLFSADLFGGAADNPATEDSLAALLDDTAAVLEKQRAQLEKEQAYIAPVDPGTQESEFTSLLTESSIRTELVFVDTDTPDYQQLVDDMLSEGDDSRRLKVILLDNNTDGIEQITAALQDYQGIDAVHLISHGEDGAVDLGSTQLTNQNLLTYQAQLQSWAEHLSGDADILFYGCDLAASADGQTLIKGIANFTGADISASDDLTGNAELGGDWELEYNVGQIEAQIALSDQIQATWQGSLSPLLWLSTDSNVSSSGVTGLDSWTEGQVLEFSGTHGETTSGGLSMVIDFDAFTIGTVDTDKPVDTGALHFVSRDITVGGANGTFELKAGDVLVSFLQDETILAAHSSTGVDTLVHDQDLLVFRPDTFNDFSAGTFTVLLDDVVADDLKGVTLIEQDTTIGGTDIAAGSFLLIAETSGTTSVDLFVPTGVGEASTTGTTTPLIDISNLGIGPDMLRGIEVIEAATTIGGQSLAKGDILATLRSDATSVGSNGLSVTQNDVFVLSLTSTGMGTTAGTATMFLDGSDVGLDNSPGAESPYALALYSVNNPPTAADSTVTTDEDIPYVFKAADFNFSDTDAGDSLQQVRIATLPANGMLELSGADVGLDQVIGIADIEAGNLVFVPAANDNGASYANFDFEVSDGVLTWPTGSELNSFPAGAVVNSMSGLAFDGSSLWLTSPNNNEIYNYGTAGNLVTSFAAPGTSPTGITFDGTNLWVISRDANMVYEIDTLGNVQSSFATPGTDSRGLTWDGSSLWLIEGNGSLIYELSTTGAVVSSFAWPDDYMRDITWDGSSLWVADTNDQKIIQIDTVGNQLSSFASPSTGATGLTFDGVDFWHADADTDTVYQLAGASSVAYSDPASMTIDVIAENDAPQVTSSAGGTSYTEQQTAVIVDSAITLEDLDGFDGADPSNQYVAEVQITGNYTVDDVLGFTNTAKIQGDLVGSALTLSVISGQTATVAEFEAALQNVTFYNGSDTPSELDRTISFSFYDGVDSSNVATKVVQVSAVNDNPVVTLPSSPANYSAGGLPTIVDANATISDVDSANFATGDLRIGFTGGTGTTNDLLAIRNQGVGAGEIGVSGSSVTYGGVTIGTYSGGTGGALLTIGFNADATSEAVQALARNILYENLSSTPDTSDRQVRFELRDGDGGNNPDVFQTVNFNSDAVISGDTSFSGNEGDPVSGTLTASDADGLTDGTYFTVSSQGGYGTAAIREGTGEWAFTPTDDNWFGTDQFTVLVTDDKGGTTEQVVSISLANVNDTPTDLITTSISESGISINEDGNDAYLVADNGLTIPLNQFTVEVQFEGNNFSNEVPFISYNTASGDMLTINTMADNTLELDIGTGAVAFSNAIDYNATLMDGQRHTLSVSWDNIAGDWSVYIDGTLIDSGTGLSTGQTIPTGGTLMFGLEQDSVGGTFESQEFFNGELYDIRLFDDVRTATEVATNYTETLPSNEPGMVANWIFDNLSSDGRIIEIVSGNHLTVQHAGGAGFTPSSPELILSAPENSVNGTVVGTLSTIDPDSGDSFTYTLLDSAGGRFDIDSVNGNITVLDSSLIDYEAAASHNITVRVTDAGGLSYDEMFTIQVVDTNDAPVEASIEGAALAYTENDGAVAITSTLTISDVDDTNIESAVVQIASGYNSSEDVLSFTDQNGIVGSYNATTGTWTLTGSATLGQYEAAIRSITYSNSSENPDTTTRTVSFTVNDGDANSNAQTRDIDITVANDAPVLAGANDLSALNEDPISNDGTLVSDMISGQVTDSDSGSLQGIAVVAVDDANGTWQYTTDGGTNWTAFASVDTANSRLLAADANTSVRFVPHADWNGTVTDGITLYAWDQTSGTAGGTADLSAGVGGTTAFSDNSASSSVTVTPSVDIVGDSLTTNEDTAISANVLTGTNGASADNFEGTPTLTAVTNGSNGTVSFLSDGTVSYTPNPNFSGSDSFTYTITSGGVTETGTVTVTVNAVTDLTAQDDSFTLNEDATLTGTVASNDSTTSGGALSYALAADVSNGSLTLNNDGSFSYTPSAHYHGPDSFTYTVTDSGSGESSTQTVSLTVNQVDDAGTFGGDVSATTNEDTATSGTVTFADAIDGYTANNFALTSGASNGTAAIDSNGNWTYTPTANYSGADSFVVQATDDDGNVETQVINITVNAVTDLTAQDDSFTLNEDATLTGTVASNDSTTSGGALSYALATNVSNGSLTLNNDGSFSYTPSAHYHGPDSFTYTVTDSGSGESSTQTVAITVNQVDDVGTFGGDVSATTNEDTATSGTVTFADAIDGYTANNFSLTSGASNGTAAIDSNGNWTYTPSANYSGTDSFVVQATDDDGNVETQAINITVNAVTDLTAQDDSFTLNEDATLTGTVASNDSTTSGGALSYAVNTGVTNGSLTLNGDGSFTYTPTANYNGSDSFTYTVTDADSGESSTQTVSLTVNPVDDAVTIGGDTTGSGAEDTTISGTLTASDSADGLTDGSYFTVSTDGMNGTASIDPATGLWSYTPTADFNGSDSFTVTVTDDDGYTATQVVNVTVTPVVDIVDDSLTTNEDTAISANVLTGTNGASADNFEGTPTLTAVTNGSNGIVSFQSDGTVTYTPNANFNGSDSFTYTITSGGVTETATVTVTVNAVTDLSATDDSFTLNEDTTLNDTVASNDSTTSGGSLSYVVNTDVTNGSLTLNGDGRFTYTPTANYNGSDGFTYTVTDANSGESSTQTVAITVNPINDTAVFGGATSGSGDEDTVISGTLTVSDSADGMTSPNYTVSTDGVNGTASIDAAGNWSYTPAANWSGSDSFTVSVTDDDGNVESQVITLTVNPVGDLTATGDSFTLDEDATLTGTVATNDSTTSGGLLSYALATDVSNGSLTLNNDGSFSYTPTAHYHGLDSFTYTVTDSGSGESSTQTVSLTVNQVDDAGTFGGDVSATTNEDAATSGTVTFADAFDGYTANNFALTSGAGNGTAVIDSNGNWTYTPSANYSGADSFVVQATDDDGNVETQVINITVNAVTDLTAQDDSFTLDEDATLTGTVASNDSTTSGGALSYAVNTGVSNGSLSFNADGSFTYTPTANYHGGDSFTYTVTDANSGESSTQTASITVNSVDDPVSINGNTSGAGNEDTTISGTLTASDNADGLTDGTYFTVSTDGTNGTASIDPATGLWSYTPTADFNGSDSFTVTVTDDDGYTDTQVISITVTTVVDIVNDTLITDEDTPITANVLTGTNGASADNFEGTPTLTAVTNGSNGTVSFQSDGTVTYTPNANFNGNDSFTYTITSGGVTETGTVNITVNAVNDLPTGAVTISGIAMRGETLTAANSLADADGMGPVTYTWKADGVEVGNGTTYTLTESEVGRVISVEASYEDQDGGNELVTSAVGVVAREPLTPLSPQPVSEFDLEPEAESEPEPEADLETASEAEPNFAREPEAEQTEAVVTTGAEQLAPIDGEILAQVLATEPAVRDSYQYEAKSYNPVPPKFIDLLNLDLAPFEPDSNEIGDLTSLMDNASFSDGLNEMKRDLDEAAAATANQEKMRAEVLLGATAGLSVGVISWVLRAGSLIAGFMSISPLWRQIDPIPVLGEENQEKDAQHAENEAENKVEQIFSREDSSR